MEVFVVDRWDENDLSDACVDQVFLKKENADKYIQQELRKLTDARLQIIEDGEFDDVPYYRFKITRKTIFELR